ENELALIAVLWRMTVARGPRGPRGPGGGHEGGFRGWLTPFADRTDALMATMPSPRLDYWQAYNLIVNFRGWGNHGADRLTEMAAGARKEFERARELDEQCALGNVGLGFLDAFLNSIAEQMGGRSNYAKTRSNWLEARS